MTSEQIIGILGAISLIAGTYFGYRHNQKNDAISERAISLEGLKTLIENLQKDNKDFRDELRYCATKVEELTKERDELSRELNRLRRKYGENGNGSPTIGGSK